MTTVPRLTVGLPVYNGEQYLGESLDALLGQSYEDFELIISDNASTDGTEELSREYQARDSAPNHNVLVEQARGEFFKWASDDDLYARDLLRRCVDALDERPRAILAHSWTAMIDEAGDVTQAVAYTLNTASASAPERFRSTLLANGGDDDGAVIRTEVLRRIKPLDSYHHADRTIISELALHGQFHQVPDWLYFRRDHPGRSEREYPTLRKRCANLDPRRANRLRHPTARLLGEYVWGYASAIRRAPLSTSDKRECYRALRQWLTSRAGRGSAEWGRIADAPTAKLEQLVAVSAVVAGQEGRTS